MIKTIYTLFIILFLSTASYPHGVGYKLSANKAYTIQFIYAGGDLMKYAEVAVFPPGEFDIPYQEGYADAEGRFSFYPVKTGEWLVEASDGMGHALSVKINHDGTETDSEEMNLGSFLSTQEILLRLLLGVSLCFNVAMVFYKKSSTIKIV